MSARARDTVDRAVAGWQALEAQTKANESGFADPKTYHQVFTDGAGEAVLADLVRMARLTTSVPPTATDAELRHVEGARALVNHILGQIQRAQTGK